MFSAVRPAPPRRGVFDLFGDDLFVDTIGVSNGKPVQGLVPLGQNSMADHQVAYRTFNYDNPTSGSFTSSGNQIIFKVDSGSLDQVMDVTLEVKITEAGTSSMQLTALPFFFDKVEIIPQDGSGDTIQTIYPEQWQLWLSAMNREDLECILPAANFNENYWTASASIAQSGNAVYRVPLLASWFEIYEPHMKHIARDIHVKFYCRNGIVVSGTGVPSLTSLKLIFRTQKQINTGAMMQEAKINSMPSAKRYLDCIRIEDTGTYTAGAERLISLENLNGKCAALVCVFRSGSSYSASSNGVLDYYDLGLNSTLDIKDPSASSVLANGNPLPADFFRNKIYPQHFRSDLAARQAYYVIPFCDNLSKAIFQGKASGYRQFTGDKHYLAVVPGSAPTAEVHTLTLSNPANDGGYYALQVGNNVTDELKYDANAAAIKAAIEALPVVKAQPGLSVTASAALTASATITWNARASKLVQGNPADRWGPVKVLCTSLNDGGVAEHATSTQSTVGIRGWTTGTYTCSIYALMWRRGYVSNGIVSFQAS